MRIKGIVLEKESHWCIILAPDGQFHRIPLPPGPVEVGQEITGVKGYNRLLRSILVAASLLVAVVAWQLWGAMAPRAVAYVSLDLNSSIELGLDRKAVIVSASGLNRQGNDLLADCPVQNLSLEDGIDQLIDHAVAAGYFKRERNIVLSTVTVAESSKEITGERLSSAIEGSLSKSGVQADVLVEDVDKDFREEAKSLGLSPGRYLVLKDFESRGVNVTAEYLNEQPLANLEREKGIKVSVKKPDHDRPGQGPLDASPDLERAGINPGAKDKEEDRRPGEWPFQMRPGLERTGNGPAVKDKEDERYPGQEAPQLPPGREKEKGEDVKANKPALPESELLRWQFTERTAPWEVKVENEQSETDEQSEKD
ncbi:MAG: anti-sigma factor domain-containing protein [Bacillota bacterium]